MYGNENENTKWHTLVMRRIKRLLNITNSREKIKWYTTYMIVEIIEREQMKMGRQC